MAARTEFLVFLALAVRAALACKLNGPLDLGRTLSSDSEYVDTPFTPGTLRTMLYNGTRFLMNSFCVGEHVGTHLDSPFHFNDSSWAVEQIPLNRLIANGAFLNVTAEARGNASFRLQPQHIDRWIQQHGAFPRNTVLLISYGRAQLYSDRSRYLGTAPGHAADFNTFNYPGMSREAASRIAEIDELVGVGVDATSIDPSGSSDAHVILAARNIYNLENVDLDQPCLPAKGFTVYSLPVKVFRGTGAPVRIVAVPNCPK